MAATAALVARLRRMTNIKPIDTVWTEAVLAEYIERYPLLDADGNAPDDSDWVASYDLHAAASDVWSERASCLADDYDFSAYDASFSQSQKYAHYLKQAAWHASRRAVGTITAQPEPPTRRGLHDLWMGNQPEIEVIL